jgi:acyl-coenzyme A thioesterase PaaI-like protein
MPSSECAVPSKPRVSVELPKEEVDDYTFTPDLAREWLGLTQEELDDLVRRSRLNRTRGLVGPLELVNGGYAFTMRSVFAYRRSLLAAITY